MSDFESKYTQKDIENKIDLINPLNEKINLLNNNLSSLNDKVDNIKSNFLYVCIYRSGDLANISTGVGTAFRFNTTYVNKGCSVDLSTYSIILPKGHTFFVVGHCHFANSTNYIYYSLYNVNKSTNIGLNGQHEKANTSWNADKPSIAFITTTEDIKIGCRVTGCNSTTNMTHQGSSFLFAIEIT